MAYGLSSWLLPQEAPVIIAERRSFSFFGLFPFSKLAYGLNATNITFALMQVSEWRHGEVGEADLAGTVVIKPLAGQGSQIPPSAEADSHAEEEEEEEEEEGADFAQCSYVQQVLKPDDQLICWTLTTRTNLHANKCSFSPPIILSKPKAKLLQDTHD